MKTVAAVATIFGMVGAVAAQNPCCDPLYILEGSFEPADPNSFTRRLDDGAAMKRQLQAPTEDVVCKASRDTLTATTFPEQPDPTNNPEWMVKGDPTTFKEEIITRMMVDIPFAGTYWKQEDVNGTPLSVDADKRVLAIHVTSDASKFTQEWKDGANTPAFCDDPNNACMQCAEEGTGSGTDVAGWTKAAIDNYYDDMDQILVILAEPSVLASWNTEFGGFTCTTSCNIYVTEDTGDVLADVYTATGKTGCDVCPRTTTTTAAGGAPTTTAAGGGSTTTTADGNSAGRLVAGMVPVATAALLALVM